MDEPFPLEGRVEELLAGAGPVEPCAPEGPGLYLGLAEPVVRLAATWQEPSGLIKDPYLESESATGTVRFVGALGAMMAAGRCRDLAEVGIAAFEWCLQRLLETQETGRRFLGTDFFTKELMVAYPELAPRAPREMAAGWQERLRALEPERTYHVTLDRIPTARNPNLYALVGEFLRAKLDLGDHLHWVEDSLSRQLEFFTPFGMYRDPNDPHTYDLTVRQNLSQLLHAGYDGVHRAAVQEVLRRGALTTLLMQSTTGQAPFGGRTNQFHIMEAMVAYLCEYEAGRYREQGQQVLASAFKRAAHLAARAIEPWLSAEPYYVTKNRFPPETLHGHDGYGRHSVYSVYGLLAAGLLAGAALIAEQTVPEGPAPVDVGGYVLHLPEAFHKVFATCGGYHLELDTDADPGYDATGLGRLHRTGVPTELGLSSPITCTPAYIQPQPRPEHSAALGPAWRDEEGDWQILADLGGGGLQCAVEVLRETPELVELAVVYTGVPGCESVRELYRLSAEGLQGRIQVDGAVRAVRLRVPLIQTDGQRRSSGEVGPGRIEVRYLGHSYTIEAWAEEHVIPFIEAEPAANRNALYNIGVLETISSVLEYRARLFAAGEPPTDDRP